MRAFPLSFLFAVLTSTVNFQFDVFAKVRCTQKKIKLGYKCSQGYLTEGQTAEVVKWLKNKEYWNLDDLVTYVEQEFGVSNKSKQSYYELLARANISWKNTQKLNPKSDEKLVKKKRKEINEILWKNKAGIECGEIIVLFLDECHLLYGDVNG